MVLGKRAVRRTGKKGAANAEAVPQGVEAELEELEELEAKQRIRRLVENAIEGIEKRLSDPTSPPSIGDYIKVMQLQKEIGEDAPKEIKVTWVEPEKQVIPVSGK